MATTNRKRRVFIDRVDGEVVNIDGADVEVGHVVMSLGEPHLIDRIEPASQLTIEKVTRKPGTRFAYAAGGFSITLIPGVAMRCRPTEPTQ